MAIDGKIGNIANFIEAAKSAAASIDHGPIAPSDYASQSLYGDYHLSETRGDIFLFGVDKWGSFSQKVGK